MVAERIREKMRLWGITVTLLASQLSASRQYAWQIVHNRTSLSLSRALEIERAVDSLISRKAHLKTFGERLRAARISAGLTLKQVAGLIGYSWVGVERWEKNVCLPKPGVLWHLCSLYGITGNQAKNLSSLGGASQPLRPGSFFTPVPPNDGAHEELARALLFSSGFPGGNSIAHQSGSADVLRLVTGQRKRATSTSQK